MTEAKRIQMSRQKPWRADNPNAVVVSRPSKWGNPFKVGDLYIEMGLGWPCPTNRTELGPIVNTTAYVVVCLNAGEAVDWYRAYIKRCIETSPVYAVSLTTLTGHDLACWCPLDQPCHADVLLELANAPLSALV